MIPPLPAHLPCQLVSKSAGPTNFQHNVHVGYDPKTQMFMGMPSEWSSMLETSNISKEDQKRNPQVVLEVLEFYMGHAKSAATQFDVAPELDDLIVQTAAASLDDTKPAPAAAVGPAAVPAAAAVPQPPSSLPPPPPVRF